MLQLLVSKNNLKFTVFIETPLKPFNKWTFPKVCQLYGLSDNPNPSIDVYPVFKFSCVDTKNEKYGEVLQKLFDKLETHVTITFIDPNKNSTQKGLAQATIQMESSLGHKRKAKEIDNEYSLDKVWEIVIDLLEKVQKLVKALEESRKIKRVKSGELPKCLKSDAEIAEFKRKNTEFLKANKKYNERYDAENAKLRVRIKEMESEFGDRITKVEQNQLQNDNSVTKQLPMVAHYEKPLVDKEMDTSLPEEPTPEVSPTNIPDSQFEQCKPVCKINNAVSKVPVSSKISEERETGLGYVLGRRTLKNESRLKNKCTNVSFFVFFVGLGRQTLENEPGLG
uniref:Uncharacterized protein n=2 Tax=Rhizophagus irregularis TaxID=588596 RepID=U9TAC0_RHIID